VEGVRGRVRRIAVDFANDEVVSGAVEQIGVQQAGVGPPSRIRCNDDTIDIDEASIALAKPQVIRAVVPGTLVEGQQEAVDLADPAGGERPAGARASADRYRARTAPRHAHC
jgi:hypothetical protein